MPARNPRMFSRIETGSGTLNSSGVGTVTFTAAFEHIPVIMITEEATPGDNVALIVTAASRIAFTVNASAGYEVNQVFYYHAIG